MKVLIEKQYEEELLSYMPGSVLTKFRFSDDYKITVSITNIMRIDPFIESSPDKAGIVLEFNVISEEDISVVKEIIHRFA